MIRGKLGLAALAAIVATVMPARAETWRDFRDTSVSCSNAATCDVEFKGGSDDIYALGFTRKAGPDAPLGFFIGVEDIASDADVALSVDGKPLLTLPGNSFLVEGWQSRFVHEGDDVAGLLAELRNASELTVKVGDGKADAFSLAGLVASLIFVDETQGRVGARDALEKKGDGEPVPAPVREIGRIADLPDEIRRDFEEGGVCMFYDQTRFQRGGPFVVRLSEQNSLYALPCSEGGAYNQPYYFYVETPAFTQRAMLPMMADEGPSVTESAWNIEWDQKEAILTGFFRGRGLGDCGEWDRWGLRNDAGTPVFVLREARYKEDCDGDNAGGPQNWPALWPR